MKRLVLNIPDSEYRFFMKVIKNFPFVEVDKKRNKLSELEFIKTLDYVEVQGADQSFTVLQNSLKQVKMMQEGTIDKQMAKDFLNELWCNYNKTELQDVCLKYNNYICTQTTFQYTFSDSGNRII